MQGSITQLKAAFQDGLANQQYSQQSLIIYDQIPQFKIQGLKKKSKNILGCMHPWSRCICACSYGEREVCTPGAGAYVPVAMGGKGGDNPNNYFSPSLPPPPPPPPNMRDL